MNIQEQAHLTGDNANQAEPQIKYKWRKCILFGIVITLVLCGLMTGGQFLFRQPTIYLTDPHSNANIEEFVTTKTAISITVDIDKKKIAGNVILSLCAKYAGKTTVILDTKNITILKVADNNNQNQLKFSLGEEIQSWMGKPLSIELNSPSIENQIQQILIEYETMDFPQALGWIPKEQTSSNIMPFIQTQCQAIGCRSLFPLQDTPYVKAPYSANIKVKNDNAWGDKKVSVFMSGNLTNSIQDGEQSEFSFQSEIEIPTYLIAFVIGQLSQKQIDERTYIISDPAEIENDLKRFIAVPNQLSTIENWLGFQEWKYFKIAVLPNSFPFLSLENPLLSQIHVHAMDDAQSVIHSLVHQYIGNLVTHAQWEDYWIIEGLTLFLERRIFGKLILNSNENEEKCIGQFGNQSANFAIDWNNESNKSQLNSLLLSKKEAQNPNKIAGWNEIKAEKGYQFFVQLDGLFAAKESQWQEFIRKIINNYRRKTIDQYEFKETFQNFTIEKKFSFFAEIDWNAWVFNESSFTLDFHWKSNEINDAIKLADDFINAKDTIPTSQAKQEAFSHNVKQIFLFELLERQKEISTNVMKMLENYKITNSNDPSLLCIWLSLSVKTDQWPEEIEKKLDEFVKSTGIQKQLGIIQKSLFHKSREKGIRLFYENKDFYPYDLQEFIKEILNI